MIDNAGTTIGLTPRVRDGNVDFAAAAKQERDFAEKCRKLAFGSGDLAIYSDLMLMAQDHSSRANLLDAKTRSSDA